MGVNLNVQIKQTYRNQAKQVANALWGSSAAHVRYKHVTVVDDDIDIHDYAAVDWAIAYRVNAGENDIVIMPSTFGAGLDPSTRKRDRDIALFGSGKWNRMLIDATIPPPADAEARSMFERIRPHNPQLRLEDFAAESSLALVRSLSPMFFGSKLRGER